MAEHILKMDDAQRAVVLVSLRSTLTRIKQGGEVFHASKPTPEQPDAKGSWVRGKVAEEEETLKSLEGLLKQLEVNHGTT